MDGFITLLNSTGKSFTDFATSMLIQSTILITVLFVLDLVLRKRVKAVFRYCIWMLILVKLVLPTTLSSPTSLGYWFGDNLPIIATEKSSTAENTVTTVPLVAPIGKVVSPETITTLPSVDTHPQSIAGTAAESDMTAAPAVPTVSLTWQGLVFPAWLGVVITMTLLLVQRTFFVKGLIAQSKDASAEMLAVFEQGRKQMKVRRRVALRLSPLAVSPAACGLFRPAILIPQSLAGKLNSKHLRSIFLHELAHIKRGDLWVSLFQTILQIVYVYNPLLWVANVMIRKVREAAVDEMVLVAMGEQAEDYPRTLLDVSRLTFGSPALSLRLIGVVESRRALAGRIRHIASRPFPKTAKLGIVGLLGVIITAAVLLPMARAQKDDTIGSTFEGRLEPHKPLAVGLVAGTAEHPELVRIEWIRFETRYGNAWGVTARVGWLPTTDAAWRLKVELLDEKGQVLRHSRDQATVFTTKAGGQAQVATRYADLELKSMQYQGRRHARRFRVHLEPSQEQIEGVDLAGPKTHALEIVVVDQESKTPITNAAVVVSSLYFRDTYRQDETICSTDSQGRCRVECGGSGLLSISVNAQKPSFASGEKTWSDRGSSPMGRAVLAKLPQRHVLEMVRTGAMGGIVHDTGGNPIDAVEVRFIASVKEPSGTIRVSRSVQTDANGRWRVDGVPSEADRVSVGFRHPEYGGDNRSYKSIKGQTLLDAQAFKHMRVLQNGLAITGKVLDDRGEPVASATVMLALRSGFDIRTHALADESGAFKLVCAADMSAYEEIPTLIVEAPGYAPAERMIDLKPDIDALEFRLTRGRNIACRVVDTAGKPVVGGWTVIKPLPENSRYSVWLEDTDEQGEFQVPNVPKNDVKLTVGKEGYITVRGFVVTPSERKVVVTMKRALRMRGTVTDAESGIPIPNFEVAVVRIVGDRSFIGNTMSFDKGTYELKLDEVRSDALQLKVSAVGYEPAYSKDIPIDEVQRVIDFKLTKDSLFDTKGGQLEHGQMRPTGPRRITGVVRDEKGKLVSGAAVSTRPSLAGEVISNAEGVFTFTTRRTSSSLGGMVSSRALGSRKETTHLLVRHKDRNLAAAVELDEDADNLDIKLAPGVILSGKVVDVEGKGIADAEISLALVISRAGYSNREATKINAEGRYEIRAVPSGYKYFVAASAEGYGQQYVNLDTAEADDGRMDLEPLVLMVANLSVSGMVVDADGKPVANADVRASGRRQPGHFSFRGVRTDTQGRFRIEGVCAARLQVRADGGRRKGLYGSVETEGGATDVKIVVGQRGPNRRYVPKQPSSSTDKSLPDSNDVRRPVQSNRKTPSGEIGQPNNKEMPTTVSGVVTDKLGRPRGNVYITTSLNNLRNAVRTDESGQFTLEVMQPQQKTWIAYCQPIRSVGLFTIPKDYTGQPVRVVLNYYLGDAEGRVVGSDGKGLANRKVELVTNTGQGLTYYSGCYRKTDEYGNYGAGVPCGSNVTVQARLADADVTERKYITETITLSDNQIFFPIPTLVIGESPPEETDDGKVLYSGRVVNEDGQPITSVKVKLYFDMPGWMSTWVRSLMADERGRWNRRLPKDLSGLRISLIHPEYIEQSGQKPSSSELLNGTNVMVMKRGLMLRGIVKNQQGVPIENALVDTGGGEGTTPYGEVMENCTTPRTLADGSFSVGGLAEGSKDIVVSAVGYAPQIVPLEIEEGMEPIEVGLKTGKTYVGLVVDAGGEPIEGVKIDVGDWQVGRKRERLTRITQTDSQGLFKIENLPDEGKVKLDFGKRGSGLQGISKEIPEDVSRRDKVVMYEVPVFVGKVVDAETGNVIKNFTLINGIDSPRFGDSVDWSRYGQKKVASEDGTFSRSWGGYGVTYPFDGLCCLRVEAKGYLPEATRPMKLGEKYEPCVVRLTKAEPLRGTIVDREGNPTARAQVGWAGPKGIAYIKNGKFNTAGLAYQAEPIVRADSNGIFELPPSREHGLIVALHKTGYASVESKNFKNGSQIRLTPWARIEGTIVSSKENRGEFVLSIYQAKLQEESESQQMRWMFDRTSFTGDNFVIDFVPSTPLNIGRVVESGQYDPVYIDPQPGETCEVRFGDEGIIAAGKKMPSLLGKPLPDLTGIEIDFSPEQHKGKMILVCFWDMNQRPSRYCIRELAKRAEELNEKEVTILAVQTSKVDENKLDRWVTEYNISFTIGMIEGNDEKTRFAWGVRSLPWLILTDRKHVIQTEGFGLEGLDEKITQSTIRRRQ